MIRTKGKYHIAIDDIGLILHGAPETPVYDMSPAPIYTSRFAQGDRTYDDFSKWWYWVQTDWYNGIQEEKEWEDNGRFYASQNVDTYSEPGVIKLHRDFDSVENFDDDAVCHTYGTVGGTDGEYFGGDGGIYNAGNGTPITDSPDDVVTLHPFKDYLWSGSWQFFGGISPSNAVTTYDGSSFTDQTSNISSALGWDAHKCVAIEGFGNGIYLGVSGENDAGIVETSTANPSAGGDYSVVVSIDGSYRMASMKIIGGEIIYMLTNNTQNYGFLYSYDISSQTNQLIKEFKGSEFNIAGTGNRYIIKVNEGLIIAVPDANAIGGELWLYDGSALTRVYRSTEFKEDLYDDEQTGYFERGGMALDGKAYFPGIVYDGGRIHNGFLDSSDTDIRIWGIGVSQQGDMYFVDETDETIVYEQKQTTNYKSTEDKNWIVFNKFSKVVGIPKLAYSLTVIFDKFDVGESITVEYNVDDITDPASWEELGTASYTDDGGEVTEKKFYFPENIYFKTIWVRLKLNSDGTSTPIINDTVMEYNPAPTQDKQWDLRVNCGNRIKLINGQMENQKGREIRGKVEQAWLRNRIVDFQDVDFAMCNLSQSVGESDDTINVDDTSDFPESGRLRIDDEVMYYSDKTQTSFTGVIRAQKDTEATAHSMTQSASGTVSSSGSSVTGTSTAFTDELQVGDAIKASGEEFQVIRIDSDTSLKIDGSPSTDWSGDSFTINPSVHNAYQVLVEGVGHRVPTLDSPDEVEYVSIINLREVK